jgi:hypothetical protein
MSLTDNCGVTTSFTSSNSLKGSFNNNSTNTISNPSNMQDCVNSANDYNTGRTTDTIIGFSYDNTSGSNMCKFYKNGFNTYSDTNYVNTLSYCLDTSKRVESGCNDNTTNIDTLISGVTLSGSINSIKFKNDYKDDIKKAILKNIANNPPNLTNINTSLTALITACTILDPTTTTDYAKITNINNDFTVATPPWQYGTFNCINVQDTNTLILYYIKYKLKTTTIPPASSIDTAKFLTNINAVTTAIKSSSTISKSVIDTAITNFINECTMTDINYNTIIPIIITGDSFTQSTWKYNSFDKITIQKTDVLIKFYIKYQLLNPSQLGIDINNVDRIRDEIYNGLVADGTIIETFIGNSDTILEKFGMITSLNSINTKISTALRTITYDPKRSVRGVYNTEDYTSTNNLNSQSCTNYANNFNIGLSLLTVNFKLFISLLKFNLSLLIKVSINLL